VVCEREALAQIDTKKIGGYCKAVDLIVRIRKLAGAAGEPERCDEILTQVRAAHKAKRNLMALLAEKGW
jgi:DNA-binding FrmR family transcriptional regulator